MLPNNFIRIALEQKACDERRREGEVHDCRYSLSTIPDVDDGEPGVTRPRNVTVTWHKPKGLNG